MNQTYLHLFDGQLAYATHISDEDKSECLQFFLLNRLHRTDDERITSMAFEHGIQSHLAPTNSTSDLLAALTHHSCSSTCRVRSEDVDAARKPLRAAEKRRSRAKLSSEAMDVDEEDVQYWRDNWPQVEDERSHNEVLIILQQHLQLLILVIAIRRVHRRHI